VLASSKTFTVYAPTNAALASLDLTIVNDSAKLSAFVGNHIATQTYFTTATTVQKRVPMLNGKYQNLLNKTVDDATIVQADRYAANGVLQVIDKMLPVLSNSWETIQTNNAIPTAQKAYMMSLFRNVFAGTDSIQTNVFWKDVFDVRNESKEYTLFVLTDAAWDSELNKFKPFCATITNNADSTNNFASWAVVKDLAIEGAYNAAAATDTVLSKFNVKVPVDKDVIVQKIKTSNGVIYIMNKVDVQPRHKILPITIEAENYSATIVDKRGNTYFRDRYNPVTGKYFRDVNVYNHGTSLFSMYYPVNDVYSGVKYKAYWVALNDFQTAAFKQKLAFGSYTANTFTREAADGYTTVSPNIFNEVLVGETTLSAYQSVLGVYLTAANSGTAAVSPLVCDYIRLEPQF
jgi:uncharacterized surface protein with fasciclin (FAS1) repeats